MNKYLFKKSEQKKLKQACNYLITKKTTTEFHFSIE